MAAVFVMLWASERRRREEAEHAAAQARTAMRPVPVVNRQRRRLSRVQCMVHGAAPCSCPADPEMPRWPRS